jgi:hypothetical protein
MRKRDRSGNPFILCGLAAVASGVGTTPAQKSFERIRLASFLK